MKSHTRNIFSVTAVTSLLNAVNFGGNFVLAVIIGRSLGVESLGLFSFILAVVMIAGVVTDFGFSTLLVRKFSERPAEAFSAMASFNRIKIIIALIVFAMLAATGLLFSKQFISITFACGAAVILPRLFQSTYESAMRALMHRVWPVAVKSVTTLLQLILSFVFLSSGGTLMHVFAVILITEITSAVFMKFTSAAFIARAGYSTASSNSPKPSASIKESFPFFLFNFFSLSIQRIYPISLEYMISSAAVGVFSAAYRFTSGAGLVTGALSNAYYPVMVSAAMKTDDNTRYRLTQKVALYALAAGTALAAVLYFGADVIIDFTFKIEAAKEVLRIISFAVIPLFVYTVLQAYLISVHMEKFLVGVYGAAWVLAIILSIALIPSRGYIGVAFVTITIEYLLLIVQLIAFFNSGKNNNLNRQII